MSMNSPSEHSGVKVDNPHALRLSKAIWRSSLTILVAFGVVGGWLYYARLDSAVVAPGVLTTKLSTRSIQHSEGGVISEMAVSEGELVEVGDLLLSLDSTLREASSRLFDNQLRSALTRRARLEAEIRIADVITFPPEVLEARSTPEVARTLSDEAAQFDISRAALAKNAMLLRTQIAQVEEEVKALDLQRRIATQEFELVTEDLKNLQDLRDKGLANQTRVTEMRRDQLSLEGEIAKTEISVAQSRQVIAGLELEIEKQRDVYRQNASELLEAENRNIRSLRRDAIVATESLSRVDIFAPVTGTIQESGEVTVGSVVGAGQVLMKVAPSSNDYLLDVKIGTNDIESLHSGAPVEIRFTAFATLEMAPFKGQLASVSRDRVVDSRTQQEYFEARVRIIEGTIPEEVRSRLVAGMSAIVYLPVNERTALEYLLSPFLRRLEGAMREE